MERLSREVKYALDQLHFVLKKTREYPASDNMPARTRFIFELAFYIRSRYQIDYATVKFEICGKLEWLLSPWGDKYVVAGNSALEISAWICHTLLWAHCRRYRKVTAPR